MASELFLLAGDDVVLDLVVRRLRDDALADQLVLPLVGAILDDLLGVGVADPGQRLEVGLRGAVEIELLLPLALGLPGVVGLLRVTLGRRLLLRRGLGLGRRGAERKSTRLNSSHGYISYAVFCLKKKKKNRQSIINVKI